MGRRMSSPGWFVLLLVGPVLLSGTRASGQGTKEDYRRADGLARLVRGKVFKERVEPRWFDANRRFWYRNDLRDGVREFLLVDAEAGTRERAFDHARLAELLGREVEQEVDADRLPFDRIVFEEDGILRFEAIGKSWRYDASAERLEEGEPLPKEPEPETVPARPGRGPASDRPRRPGDRAAGRSPDGRFTAVVRDRNVSIRDNETEEVIPLTSDGTEEDGFDGRVYWAPDSSRFVALRTVNGEERKVYLIESSPRDQLQPKLHSYDYRKPGDRVPVTRPHLFDALTKQEIPVPNELFENPWSVGEFRWAPDSSRFTFLFNERGHQTLRIIAVDATTGAARPIVDERSPTFIDYNHKTYSRFLDATNELVWMSERNGWNHLYLIDAETGEVKNPITSGDWLVHGVDRFDEETRQIWFRASGIYPDQDPYYIHFARVNLDGSGLTLLTEGDGTHDIAFSPDRRYLIDRYSRVDMPPVTELRRVEDGSLVCELERADWSDLLATGWTVPERFVARGRDGETDIHGVIFRPSHFDGSKPLPVIEQIYAGPQGAFVPKSFAAYHGPQGLAELGFVLVQIDGMGTNWRSKAFHDVCWQNLGDAGFPDRIAWLKAAAEKYPEFDLSRVGIYGGSAGGQNAMGALLFHPDFYKVGVADCGCHDNRMDKIWWNEHWMGYPVGPEYEAASNVVNAHKLQGKLLLTVGEMDRNVDPASTMQVVDALIRADKDFELIVFPGGGHGAGGSPYGRRRMRDFFVRHLHNVEPRAE